MTVLTGTFSGFISILPRDGAGCYATALLPFGPPAGVTGGQMFESFDFLLHALKVLGVAESELPAHDFTSAQMIPIEAPTQVLQNLKFLR